MASVHKQIKLHLIENAFYGPGRVIIDRTNPLEILTEDEVFRRYRFRPQTILYVVGLLINVLQFGSKRNSPLTPLQQVLVFLRFLATGSYQIVIGDTLAVSQSTVCRCCRRVGCLLARLTAQFVRFDFEKDAMKQKFKQIAGFPNVIGCVDGTQIKISKPKQHEHEYVNRKGFHSLNIQMICDANFMVTNLVAKWPGSTHDARIWRESELCKEFENGTHNGFILGDSGYACKNYLLTPFINPQSPEQNRYNTSLCRTRVLIEQTFGIIKKRFPVLHFGIRSDPSKAIQYISSCVILHNIGITHGDIVEHDNDIVGNTDHVRHVVNNVIETGNNMRLHIVETFFS